MVRSGRALMGAKRASQRGAEPGCGPCCGRVPSGRAHLRHVLQRLLRPVQILGTRVVLLTFRRLCPLERFLRLCPYERVLELHASEVTILAKPEARTMRVLRLERRQLCWRALCLKEGARRSVS